MPATKYNCCPNFPKPTKHIHREWKTHIYLWLSLRRDQSTNKTSRDISSFLKIAGKQIHKPLVAILIILVLCQMLNIFGSTHSVSPAVYSSLWLRMYNVLGRHWYNKKMWLLNTDICRTHRNQKLFMHAKHNSFLYKTLLFLTEPCKQQDCYVHSDKWYLWSTFCGVGINKGTSYTISWMK